MIYRDRFDIMASFINHFKTDQSNKWIIKIPNVTLHFFIYFINKSRYENKQECINYLS